MKRKRITKEGRVTAPPSGPITTPAAINKANAEFWKQAEILLADQRKMLNQGMAIRAKAKGTHAGKRSAASRIAKNIERDRRIHDMHAEGVRLKVIAGELGIKNQSTVSRVLNKPRP